jgi:hypothetical protein
LLHTFVLQNPHSPSYPFSSSSSWSSSWSRKKFCLCKTCTTSNLELECVPSYILRGPKTRWLSRMEKNSFLSNGFRVD